MKQRKDVFFSRRLQVPSVSDAVTVDGKLFKCQLPIDTVPERHQEMHSFKQKLAKLNFASSPPKGVLMQSTASSAVGHGCVVMRTDSEKRK